MRMRRSHSGFTLLELLVVIAIIAILSTGAVVVGQQSLRRSRDAQRKSDIKNVADALEVFYSDYGRYPDSDAAGQILACPFSIATDSGSTCTWGVSQFSDANGTIYFNRLPEDPNSGISVLSAFMYYYSPTASRDAFILYANLEIDDDADSARLGCTGGTCSGYDIYIKSTNYIAP